MRTDGEQTRAIMLFIISRGGGNGFAPTTTGLVKEMKVSRGLVYKYTKEMEIAGYIYRNRYGIWCVSQHMGDEKWEIAKAWISHGKECVIVKEQAIREQLDFFAMVQS